MVERGEGRGKVWRREKGEGMIGGERGRDDRGRKGGWWGMEKWGGRKGDGERGGRKGEGWRGKDGRNGGGRMGRDGGGRMGRDGGGRMGRNGGEMEWSGVKEGGGGELTHLGSSSPESVHVRSPSFVSRGGRVGWWWFACVVVRGW